MHVRTLALAFAFLAQSESPEESGDRQEQDQQRSEGELRTEHDRRSTLNSSPHGVSPFTSLSQETCLKPSSVSVILGPMTCMPSSHSDGIVTVPSGFLDFTE